MLAAVIPAIAQERFAWLSVLLDGNLNIASKVCEGTKPYSLLISYRLTNTKHFSKQLIQTL
jgi:hypothetical protein